MTPWIEAVSLALQEASEVPLFGHPPEFAKEPFVEALKSLIGLDDLSLEISGQEWIEKEDLLSGLGENPSVLSIALEPLKSHIYLAMSQETAVRFSSLTLSTSERSFAFQDDNLQKGYYLYAMTQVLAALKKSGNYPDLSFRFDANDLTLERSFSASFCLKSEGDVLYAKLIIPKSTQSEVKKHYLSKLPNFKDLKSRSSMMVHTSLIAGSVELSSAEMTKLQVGDFVILDHASYHPNTKKGYLQLSIGKFALVQLKIKEDHLKVLDYAYQTEGVPMLEEDDFAQDSSPIEDILGEKELEIDEFELDQVLEEPVAEIVESKKEEEEPLFHPSFIPLTLSVEVAKLSISLEKLLELQPGNILPTSVSPESGVKLCLNGRPVARGELMNLGDAIGVKITEITAQK